MNQKKMYSFISLSIIVLFVLAFWLQRSNAVYTITWGTKWEQRQTITPNVPSLATTTTPAIEHHDIGIGIYSSNEESIIQEENLFAINHEFVNWNNYKSKDLQNFLNQTIAQNRWPMVTVEPFGEATNPKDLFSAITSGSLDIMIINVCQDLGAVDHPIFIRFMHEMDHEANVGRYPWAGDDYNEFITAYQYFVNTCRQYVTDGYYVWSPVGSETLQKYYPGDSFVDYIGLSLYSFPEWEFNQTGTVYTFDQVFSPKYQRITQYNKKVMLAEFAVIQSGDNQDRFIADMKNSLYQYPLLDLIVYFNANEPYPEGWGMESTTEIDWHINSQLLFDLKN